MAYDEKVYKKLLDNFNLLCNILKQNTSENQSKADLSKIDEIINKKIPDTLKKNAPEDFYELYTDFKFQFEKFREFILYDKLIGKNVVALGGGFSSGKSSFLNALMGERILPEKTEPSTSVPTYMVSGEKNDVMGINIFDTKVQIRTQDIKKISHGFGKVADENEIVTEDVTLGHILDKVFVSTPIHRYENIAFLDTPGYSKADSEEHSAKTDETIARGQLKLSNYILWFIKAETGTITEEDIKFILSLKRDIPILIIVNKADTKPIGDLKDIINKIKSVLNLRGIRFIDVLAFTSKPEQIGDEKLNAFIKKDTNKIKKQLEEWNNQVYVSNFARNFKVIFVRCKEFYEDEIEEESRKLTRLNTAITKLSVEDIDPEILEPLKAMVKDAQKNVNELKGISVKLKELQDEFFTEIKFISDVVGIDMPEPSEIDLLQDKAQTPLDLIEEYKKKKGIATDSSIVDMLQEVFENVKPTINKLAGGTEYRSELVKVLKEFSVKAEDIHINDIIKSKNDDE